jgi:hypothetical protein
MWEVRRAPYRESRALTPSFNEERMISWQKRGMVFNTLSQGSASWMKNSALTPTPFRVNDSTIRVYAGFRDDAGVSRIGFVDVAADNPTTILKVSDKPVIDIGRDGCFDDNGMILGDIVAGPDGIYMFYVGFQLVAKAKFLAFSGLACSIDGGNSFHRVSEAPILGRGTGQTTIGAIHSVRYEGGRWRIWYASGDAWEYLHNKPFPRYDIHYVETSNLLEIPRTPRPPCVQLEGDEYRIGRPRVYHINGQYVMYYTKGTRNGAYFPGMALSKDGLSWTRRDTDLGIQLSPAGWDSNTLCYPAIIQAEEKCYMFYNGNNMGFDGFGYAEATGLALE